MLVRNAPDAGSLNEAEPDSGDFRILGEANSGVISGGEVTASSPESMVVNVAAARVVLNGAPYSFSSQALTLTPSSGGFDRFDLVGWTSAGPSFLTGIPSGNQVFPSFDPKTFVAAASVYVTMSATQISQARITEKIYHPLESFKRIFTGESDVVVDLTTPAQVGGFKVLSDGRLQWVNSVLRRTALQAMEFLTTLTVKQPISAVAALVVKAASGADDTHTVFKVESSGSTVAMASVSGGGRIQAANLRRGSGNPNGVVPGIIGDEYTDIAQTNPNLMKWVKTSATGSNGWVSLRSYSASESALPTGALIPWVGVSTDTVPAGFSLCNGGNLAVDAGTTALAALLGTNFGTAPSGFVKLPDIRNRVLGGTSTTEIDGVGTLAVGSVLGQNVRTLALANMPSHSHGLTDPGHRHPIAGPRWYYKPGVHGWPSYRPGGAGSPGEPGLWVEDQNWERSSKTGIAMSPVGSGDDFNVMQATIGMSFLVKW